MSPATIEEVIARLESIVADAHATGNCLGIFSQLYLHVTRSVYQGLQKGVFINGRLMEQLDVNFANRYLDAYDCYHSQKTCSQSWLTAFEAAKRNNLLALQHLLMGMNAHINLDLGISTAETIKETELPLFKEDFFAINNMLANSIDTMQDRLSTISPLLFLLDWFGKKSDEHFAEFSLVKARSHAWLVAKRLSRLSPSERKTQITELDRYVAVLNRLITDPGIIGGALIKMIKWFEVKDVRRVIDVLAADIP